MATSGVRSEPADGSATRASSRQHAGCADWPRSTARPRSADVPREARVDHTQPRPVDALAEVEDVAAGGDRDPARAACEPHHGVGVTEARVRGPGLELEADPGAARIA